LHLDLSPRRYELRADNDHTRTRAVNNSGARFRGFAIRIPGTTAAILYARGMDFKQQLTALIGKSITVCVIGSAQEYAGALLDVGPDYVSIDSGPDNSPHQVRSMIPLAAISCVISRV